MQKPFLLFSRFKCLVQCCSAARTRRFPARCEMAWRPASGLCGRVRTRRRLHARRPIVCPHITNVVWCGWVRSSAQLAVLRAWLADDQAPRRSVGVRPSSRPRSGPIFVCSRSARCVEDPGYITFRLARRLVWLSIWTRLAPVFGTGFRRWVRAARTQYRRWLLHTR